MARQTTAVLCVFVCIHLALILMVISIATPEWLQGDIKYNSTIPTNSTKNVTFPTNTTNKGLWEVCFDGECSSIDRHNQTTSFQTCQGLSMVGAAGTLIATLIFYVFLFVSVCKGSKRFHLFMLVMQIISWACFLAMLVLFGTKDVDTQPELEDYDVKLGWSYWLAVTGGGVGFLALLANVYEAYLLWTDTGAPYENL